MGKTYFLFGVHNHQPVGNFPHIFEEAYQKCYLPFLTLLEAYPKVKCNFHISGPLYDWVLDNHREYISKLKMLVDRGQIEIISGAYYEPILPLIADEDKLSQIKFMNEFIKEKFSVTPKGIWVAERVWEPYLARIINLADLKYTFLDDTHFRYAGLSRKEFTGYYLTEDNYFPIYIFPISKSLRYKIPFSLAGEAINLLKSFSARGDILVTLFDDGEKFGLWPYTFDWVYGKEWLKQFFELLTQSMDKIETITASEALEQFQPQEIVYLPCASYQEMGEWVLEPESFSIYQDLQNFLKKSPHHQAFHNFVRGGFFRNFYRKYPRLNYMHKRMLSLSKKINIHTTPEKNKKVFCFLWKAQCNCAYWHGIFGGFYLPHIRDAVYYNLIKAEEEFDKKYVEVPLIAEEMDIDLDGNQEIILKNRELTCIFTSKGGSLIELSMRSRGFNLLNTITRREESYHSKIKERSFSLPKRTATIHDIIQSKEKDLESYLIYDSYEKVGLVDHILSNDIDIRNFKKGKGFTTLGNQLYDLNVKRGRDKIDICFSSPDKKFTKIVSFSKESEFLVIYEFKDNRLWRNNLLGVEWNLFFPSWQDIKVNGQEFNLGEIGLTEKTSLLISDFYKRITVEFTFDKADLFILPVYSVSSSESGFEKVFQQLCLLFIRKIENDRFHLACFLKKEE
ncbi:MAG: DUF1926 domain-containing protein [Candidatus Omnitrophica bacterium]|nr:DUF1926 domain-containing protein [Candidatus Omnitrophota bacterium]